VFGVISTVKALFTAAIAGAALAGVAGAAPPVVMTLAASPTVVAYGAPVTLSGQLGTKKADQQISIQATECGSTKQTKVTTVRTVANGAFSVAVKPTIGTAYTGRYKNGTSPVVSVTVKPVLTLTRVARGKFTAKVTAGRALTGKFLSFQRYKKLRKRWGQVKRVALGAAVAGPAKPTMITSVSFKSKLPRKSRVRVLISTAQAAPCYVTAASKPIRA
jgi:hypothetical protein